MVAVPEGRPGGIGGGDEDLVGAVLPARPQVEPPPVVEVDPQGERIRTPGRRRDVHAPVMGPIRQVRERRTARPARRAPLDVVEAPPRIVVEDPQILLSLEHRLAGARLLDDRIAQAEPGPKIDEVRGSRRCTSRPRSTRSPRHRAGGRRGQSRREGAHRPRSPASARALRPARGSRAKRRRAPPRDSARTVRPRSPGAAAGGSRGRARRRPGSTPRAARPRPGGRRRRSTRGRSDGGGGRSGSAPIGPPPAGRGSPASRRASAPSPRGDPRSPSTR